MYSKLVIALLTVFICNTKLTAQSKSPVKRFSLKTEATDVLPDSLGTTVFYSLSFEINNPLVLTSAVFKLKGLVSDSLFNSQTFTLPTTDGIYQTGNCTNGLIKDQHTFFILLGNIKAPESLILVAEFTDSTNKHYQHILTNE